MGEHRGRLARSGLALAGTLALMLAMSASALAAVQWHVSARPAPTQLPLSGEGVIVVDVGDVSDVSVSATPSPVTITDTLPEGVTATKINPRRSAGDVQGGEGTGETEASVWKCSKPPTKVVICTYDAGKVTPEHRHLLDPYESMQILIAVSVNVASPTVLSNAVTVTGGREVHGGVEGAEVPKETLVNPLKISGLPTAWGLEENGYALTPENENGQTESQAGSHPFQLTTKLAFNEVVESENALYRHETEPGQFELFTGPFPVPAAPALVKTLRFNLPPGVLGNVVAIPACSDIQFSTIVKGTYNECPNNTTIGVAKASIEEATNAKFQSRSVPVFNLEPGPGEPARFGFELYRTPVILNTAVRSGGEAGSPGGGDFGVEVTASTTTQLAQVLSSEVTLWGVPGDETHDSSRGWGCVERGEWVEKRLPCTAPAERSTIPFLTLPTACAGPLATTVTGETWPIKGPGEPGPGNVLHLESSFAEFPPSGFEGCAAVPFAPSIKLKPSTQSADTPTGLLVDVHVPQETTLEKNKLGESDVRATTVTLPAGVELSPSAANGLEACSEEQIGYQGKGGVDPFAPQTEEPRRFSAEPARCPSASKVGTVTVHSPLLKHVLTGSVYLAEQERNPFGSLLAIYIVAEDPRSVVEEGKGSGIRVKLAGEVKLNPVSGQISSTFENTPQVPFGDFEVSFDEGPRASVSTPGLCGKSYVTEASFTAWAEGRVVPSSTDPKEFEITSGPGSEACGTVTQPFSPSFSAGSVNPQAGAFTPFTVDITRPDADQALKSVSTTLPPGLAAMLSSTTPCKEPQAELGTCGAESLIGHATAVSGFGPDPFTVTGGRVFITGPYHGAPFGLSIVTPAVAGPFNLGEVVVRATINVDHSTAAVTIDNQLPTIVQGVGKAPSGIPLQLKKVHVVVDRPGFQFNPTNCTPMKITGTLGGAQGASAPVSAPFQVANCASLPFHPILEAKVGGHASKANGVSFIVKVTSTPGQANIAKTDLTLPIALPSRLSTLQKACLAAVFEVNPATCAEGSVIGTAIAHTPVLKSPLIGPAYLVSHGSEAFPDVEFVLQGEGITLVLDGKTDIKKGITYSRFETVPDAPVSTFETVLPTGPHSALTANVPTSANYSLCGTSLAMPTKIVGQNGAVIERSTNIAITGCGVVVTKTKISGHSLLLTVSIPSAGRLTAAGANLSTVKRNFSSAQTAVIKLKLAKKAVRSLARHHKVKVTARVSFAPTQRGEPASAVSTAAKFRR